ncbi:tetratricopeptide repeat protein [Aquisalinus flavus]|uniref:Localization factor PodJL n=1 Tax=Aquisalinus flavus TaxID=1526572 RepID=A0A8J2Y539_9PROT|nr:tetratricopeptide repeat protein [Aquisalinus flavus]MBD0426471.1 SEL1-like repeat protein [Aquisalinus flavus]UNE47975.1 hypothetical protein FF099_07905 [Aquisalinus flavus]GGD07669.1 localization factor PodJL [Aquisalinus flavus]
MKPNTPWSIKGIDPDARDAAKKAARAAGMTLGEWLNQQILESSQDGVYADDDAPARPAMTASPITLDHLRELVASLNRLNDKLQRTEKNNREEIAGLNQGLTSALERIRSMEAARASNSTDALIARIERIEAGGINRQSIDGLKALEKALSRTLNQFESIREETIGRVEANETAIEGLTSRVDMIDAQFSEAIVDLRQNVDAVTTQISATEESVSALMQEAREASNSNDEAFIERTSKKMRILGNEIKRTSDRIQALDSKILKLAGRIDASEQRSAEGISEISRTVSELSSELTAFDRDQGSTVAEARKVIESASSAADDRLTTLKKSFDTMLLRIEGIADGERAARESQPLSVTPAPAMSRPVAPPPELSQDPEFSPDEEFDSMAGEQAALAEPDETLPGESIEDDLPPPVTDLQEDTDLPEVEDDLPPEVVTAPAVKAEKQDPLRAAMKGAEDAAPNEEDFDAIFGEPVARDPSDWDDDDTPELDLTAPPPADTRRPAASRPEETLTPKQKVILAARARRKRLEEQSRPAAPAEPLAARQPAPEKPSEDKQGASLIAGLTARLRGNAAETEDTRESQAEKLRRKYSTNGDAKGGLPMIPLILAGVLAVCLLGWFLLKDTLPQNVSAIDRPQPPQQQAPAQQPAATPLENYDRAEAALSTGRTAEGVALLRQSAEAGYPPAQFQLAELTRDGELGLIANPVVARQLYADAAEAGNVPAMHKLGSLYASGEGGEKNDFTALSWFEQAAAYGYVDSMYNLGLLYDPEVSLEVDDQILDSAAQAYYWYSLADRLGDPDAGDLAAETGAGLSDGERAQQDQRIAAWSPQQPIRSANREFTGR